MKNIFKSSALVVTLLASSSLLANEVPRAFLEGRAAVLRQAGCYVVDYSFVETESLKDGYVTDKRVYDTNSNKTTYELIVPIQKSPTEIRLQHVLFMKDFKTGEVRGLIKHNAEDWAYESSHVFDFVSPGLWNSVPGKLDHGWTRKITNLDDGLRYQCEAQWDLSTFNPEWSCANFAPIPGRETRDMGRKDYNTLDRKSRVIVYENSWVERQDNVKTILADGVKTPLAREAGRTWYVRQPDAACAEARAYAENRKAFWNVLMEVWEEYLATPATFSEKSVVNGMPRFAAMYAVEDEFAERLNSDPSLTETVKSKIRAVIDSYRN
ncbi:MAG: DUF6607 family protein [Bdellovibrionota bacterium]